jgi:pimeloyl-ACP methyl ester carboxylesterase
MRFDAFGRLGMINSRTLVIHGSHDGLLMPECGEILARSIPGSSLYICDDASHSVFREKWSEVKPVILDFLSRD